MELLSAAGGCASSMTALRSAAAGVRLGEHDVAVAVGSELMSRALRQSRYAAAGARSRFDAEFLRWTLSDGARGVVLEPAPRRDGLSLRLDWTHLVSSTEPPQRSPRGIRPVLRERRRVRRWPCCWSGWLPQHRRDPRIARAGTSCGDAMGPGTARRVRHGDWIAAHCGDKHGGKGHPTRPPVFSYVQAFRAPAATTRRPRRGRAPR